MATRIDTTLLPSNSTNAMFRAWVQFVEDLLVTTGGWVVTGDTGQMTIATATAPGGANTKVGYRVYRMADALQATAPVYLRIDYGSAAAAATPGMWWTIGQGSDGAGAITSVRYNGGASSSPNFANSGNSATGTYNSYGSAGTGRVQMGLFVGTTSTHGVTVSLERSKDATGADTGDGVILMGTDAQQVASAVGISRWILLGTGAQPPLEKGLFYALSGNNPSAFGSDVGIGIPIPMRGVAQPPGLGYVVTRTSDFVAEAQFSVTIYGASHNFVHLNSMQGSVHVSGNPNADSTSRMCMRYE